GRGSVVDVVDPVVVESAAVLARHLRQGRDRRLAVLEWFAEAGVPALSGAVRVPEPPLAAVREAVVWVLRRTVSHRLLELARGAAGAGEEAADALYEVAGRLLATRPYRGSADPALVRAALEADEDVPDGPDFRGMVHLVAAIGLGAQEVGGDVLAEAFGAFTLFGLTAEDWAQMLGAVERGESPPVDWGLLQQHADVLGLIQQASDEQLLRARTVLLGLRMFYGLHVMHALFMPDTPALAALRAKIDELGVFPLLDHVIALSPSPTRFAQGLAIGLEPLFDGLYEMLMEQLTAEPGLFQVPGDETGAAGFMETWIRSLHEQTARARERVDTSGEEP
ncbi:hypothetical protein, partial [Streptomyces sp. NRRL S-241]|uniref:hypothetical protein n=1 Tax=Streptomyces sp. NRRL S-241 TaxID=1463896 RepID=UPI00068A5297